MPKPSTSSVKVFYPQFDTQKVIEILQERIEEIKPEIPLKLVVLFGSYAKGNYTARSDIDLLIVYKGQEREDAYKVIWKGIQIPRLQLHLYTEEEYSRAKTTIERMLKEGKTIYQD